MTLKSDSIGRLVKKYRVFLILAGVILLVASAYAVWSKSAWDSYQEHTSGRPQEVKVKLDAALAMSGKSKEERKKKLAALEEARALITKQNGACVPNSLIRWQRLWNSLAEHVEKCHQTEKKLAALGTATEKVTSYLAGERMLSDILTRAPHLSEIAEDRWEAQATAWVNVTGEVSAMSTSEVFHLTKQTAVKTTKTIETAWRDLLKAHKAQDRAKYEEAHQQLIRAYGGISAISDTATSQLALLLKKFDAAYDNTF